MEDRVVLGVVGEVSLSYFLFVEELMKTVLWQHNDCCGQKKSPTCSFMWCVRRVWFALRSVSQVSRYLESRVVGAGLCRFVRIVLAVSFVRVMLIVSSRVSRSLHSCNMRVMLIVSSHVSLFIVAIPLRQCLMSDRNSGLHTTIRLSFL